MDRQLVSSTESTAIHPRGSSATAKRSPWSRLFETVDIASLVYFRVAFGTIMLLEVAQFFWYGWIGFAYIDPVVHFTYYGFDWVRPWPGVGMYLHFFVLGVSAIFIILGLWYRVSASLFFLGFTYVFLLDQGYYLNHFYLFCLISFLMIFVPAHRALSIDAIRRPNIRASTAPTWALWMLLAQFGVVHFYAGVTKLSGDWLRGEPMRTWLPERTERPFFDYLLSTELTAYLFSYGGLLFDLLIVPLLLWRRTRLPAFALAVSFHLLNWEMFGWSGIGLFPLFMIAALPLFIPPPWPRPGDVLRMLVGRRVRLRYREPAVTGRLQPKRFAVLVLLGLYFTWQLLMPLRHFLYPGDVAWTSEGHLFAWRMLATEKEGSARFFATEPTSGEVMVIDSEKYLNGDQSGWPGSDPDKVLQFSHFIADELRKEGYDDVEVRARVMVSLNGREPRPLVDPTVDLAAQPRTLLPREWITPQPEEPL